jgi:hypothetical protein
MMPRRIGLPYVPNATPKPTNFGPELRRDLHRLKLEIYHLQAFSCLAFPFSQSRKTTLKQLIFGDELVTSFVGANPQNSHFGQSGFRHMQNACLMVNGLLCPKGEPI